MRKNWQDVSIAAALLLLVLVVYGQVGHFEFFLYDDRLYVTLNEHVMAGLTADSVRWAFTSTEDANWFPLTRLSFILNRQLFGPREAQTPRDIYAAPYHWTNVLLHAACTLLLFALLRRMTGASWPSALVAFLFALHPQHVESVAWVAERKDVLSALFWMLALWSYVSYQRRPRAYTYALTLLFYCLGFMAKPMVVTLPLVLLLLDVWPLQRLIIGRKLIWEKLPFFALALAMSVTTYMVQHGGGAVRTLDQTPLTTRLGNALLSAVIYIGKTFWPTRLTMYYPMSASQPAWQLLGAALILAGITLLALRLVRTRPYLAAGWFWYLITVLPVIGIIQVGRQARADRYTYIPTIGISIMLAWGGADVWRRWPKARPLLAGLCAAACVALLPLTWRQISYWESTKTMCRHTVDVDDQDQVGHACLAVALQEEGIFNEQAIAEYRKALAMDPTDYGSTVNLSLLLYHKGQLAETASLLSRASSLNPDNAEAHNTLGLVLAQQGRQSEAVAQFEAAVRLKPAFWEAHIRLGNALTSLGRTDEAKAQFSLGLVGGGTAENTAPALQDNAPSLNGGGGK